MSSATLRPAARAFALALVLATPASAAQEAAGGRITQRDLFTDSNVLTPGEADPWPIAVRDGETLIVSVASHDFDPAVELVSPAGAVVAENDDVRPGEQNALLLTRVAAGGAYVVRVKSFKAKAGGSYEISVRRFVAVDTPAGKRTAGVIGSSFAQWHRFDAAAGQTLVVTARSVAFPPSIEIYAPDGSEVPFDAAGPGQAGVSRAIFRAAKAGAYHARVASNGGDERASYTVTVAAARAFPATVGAPAAARSLEAGGVDLWTFKAAAGDVVRVSATAPGAGVVAQIAYVPEVDASGVPREPETQTPPVVLLPSDPKAPGELVAALNVAGGYQITVSQPLAVAVAYSLAASDPRQPLAGAGPSAALPLGGSAYWAVDGKAGQILRLDGASNQFDAQLELYGPRGTRVAANDDGAGGRDAALTALLVESGKYLIRVSAFGNGGSGAYTLRRVENPARPVALGAHADGTLGASGSEVWSFAGRAGQSVIVSAKSSDVDTRVTVYGPDAVEVASDDDGGDGTNSLLATRLPVDGVYTVWVSAKSGSGAYTLRVIEDE